MGKKPPHELGTAILIIIDARFHDFNGFPVVNWY